MTDLPYLEPLLLHLRNDESLEIYFSKADFFAEPKTDPNDIKKLIESNCPSPRSIWIFPGESIPFQRVPNKCFSKAKHTFYVTIITQCIRDQYMFVKRDDQVKLGGSVIELTELREAVKNSIARFTNANDMSKKFDFIYWAKDEMIALEENFLIATSVFDLQIY